MAGTVIDGNALAEELSDHVHEELRQLQISGARPGLATILVGDDHAAAAYERHVRRLAERLECEYANEHLPDDAELADVLAVVGKLNADPRVTGHPGAAAASRGDLRAARVSGARSVQGRGGRPSRERGPARPGTPSVRPVDARVVLLPARCVRAARPDREPESFYPGQTLVVVGPVGLRRQAGGVARAPAARHRGDVPLAHARPGRVHAAGGHPDRGGRRGGPRDRRHGPRRRDRRRRRVSIR